ncbi:MAG: OmpA family protein [Candidatus Melainabacteria bacterium]|nr:MAG: OmpA family protein [Candidatus Melainabacteria bacterium]
MFIIQSCRASAPLVSFWHNLGEQSGSNVYTLDGVPVRKLFIQLLLSLISLAAMPSYGQDPPPSGAPVPGPAPKAVPKPANGLQDYTDKLKMVPGVVITFPIVDGIDTRRNKIGNYDFTATIHDNNAEGFGYKWTMSKPAEAQGFRAVAPEDEKGALLVSLFYQDGQSFTMSGYTNTVRISDALFKGLKSGRSLPFQIDLEDPKDVPSKIRMIGREYVGIFVNGKKARVRAIKTETDNQWHYWIMDKSSFPIIVQGDGPFKWSEPRFQIGGGAGSGINPDAESQRLIKDLEKNGVATSHAILFAFNSAKLQSSSKQILNGIATYLTKSVDVKLAVEGHCDIVGSAQYNKVLSQKRANAVRDYLVLKGVAAARLRPEGYGFSKPIADNKTAQGRAQNRQVVFRKI